MPDVTAKLLAGKLPLARCKVDLLRVPGAAADVRSTTRSGDAPTVVAARTDAETIGAGTAGDDGAVTISVSATIAKTDRLQLRILLEDDGDAIVRVTKDRDGKAWEIFLPAADKYFSGKSLALGDVKVGHDQPVSVTYFDPAKKNKQATAKTYADEAASVYAWVAAAYAWYAGLGFTATLPAVSVLFPFDRGEDDSDRAFYRIMDARGWIILPPAEGKHRALVLHELGHHAFFQGRGDGYEGKGWDHLLGGSSTEVGNETGMSLDEYPHYEDQIEPAWVADWLKAVDLQLKLDFSEGYATFFGQCALGSTKYKDASGSFDIETGNIPKCKGCGDENKKRKNGYGDAPTAGYLWDLADGKKEKGDAVAKSFKDIHALYTAYESKTLPDFHAKLKAFYSAESKAIEGIAALNDLAKVMRYTSAWLADPKPFEVPATR